MHARRLIPIALTTASVLAFTATAGAATGRYTAGGLTATFSASTTRPNCKQKWPVTVTATYHGRKARGTAYYQFLFGGQLESTQYPYGGTSRNPHSHLWSFDGSFYDNTFGPFGANAVGYKIDVRAVVQVNGVRAYPGLIVTVQGPTRGCPPSR